MPYFNVTTFPSMDGNVATFPSMDGNVATFPSMDGNVATLIFQLDISYTITYKMIRNSSCIS